MGDGDDHRTAATTRASSVRSGLDRHLVLVGAMGSGKTTIGSRLADALGLPFLDNDIELHARTGATAAEMAERLGTEALHDLERHVLLDLLAHSTPSIIGAAASTVDDADVRRQLRGRAVVVWLDGDVEVHAERAERSQHRPFFDEEAHRVQLARDRAKTFEQVADIVVDTASVVPEEAVAQILRALTP